MGDVVSLDGERDRLARARWIRAVMPHAYDEMKVEADRLLREIQEAVELISGKGSSRVTSVIRYEGPGMTTKKTKVPKVSTKLLRRQLEQTADERDQGRLVLAAVVKMFGRVRVPKRMLDGIDESDKVNPREDGEFVVFEHSRE